jgi:hypothetical protein
MAAAMTRKAKLIALLVLLAVFIAVHGFLQGPVDPNSPVVYEWHYWLALLGAVVVVAYAFSIRCAAPGCGRRQVFRGWSAFDLRWPGERCYHCNAPLDSKP